VFLRFIISTDPLVQAITTTKSDAFSELFIGVPKISNNTLFTFTETINSTEGAEYVMSYPEHRLILIKYENKIHPTKEDIVKTIENKNITFLMYIKEGN
jgi:hypothetical protein